MCDLCNHLLRKGEPALHEACLPAVRADELPPRSLAGELRLQMSRQQAVALRQQMEVRARELRQLEEAMGPRLFAEFMLRRGCHD